MIEKYGVEFQALTDKFKTKMQELANDIRNFGKEAEEETSVMPKFINTGYQKQIEYVKSQMQDIRDLLDRADAGEEIGKDTMKLEADYETLSYKLEDLIEKQKEFNGELDDTNEEASKSTLGDMFDKSISKIKRFTYYLLGARSVFSLFMKYQGIYYQYNEQMQYQSELSQNAIALSLAPAFEFLGNMVAYASIAFAKFIELLTGVNVLSKVSTKGIRDYNKGLKETQTLVSGIDEITNLTMPTGTGLASQYKALEDFQKKVAEVEKFFNENKWIKSLADGLKQIFEWIGVAYNYIKDHWDVFQYIFGGVAISFVAYKAISGIQAFVSALASPIGQIALLVGATVGLVSWLDNLSDSNYKAKTATEKLEEAERNLTNFRDKQKEAEDEYIDAIDRQTEAKKKLTTLQQKYKININDLLKKIEKEGLSYKDLSDKEKEVYKAYRDLTNATKTVTEKTLKYKNATIDVTSEETKRKGAVMELDKAYDKTFTDLIKRYRNGEIEAKIFTASVMSYMEGMSEEYRKTFVHELPDDIKEAFGETDNVIWAFKDGTEMSFKEIESSANKHFKTIQSTLDETFKDRISKISIKYNIDKNSVLSLVNKVKGISSLMGVPTSTFDNLANKILKNFGYAKGLDYVPYDNYPALLHKGETVVPAKYNPTIHSVGNEYTNSLLETMIIKMDDLANRPNVFEIDGKKFANATYGYYDNARSRQGYVEGVIR